MFQDVPNRNVFICGQTFVTNLVVGAMKLRIHPLSLALRYLKGQQTIRGAPFYGRALYQSPQQAIEVLKRLTGQDFGTDAVAWGKWLRQNRWVYYARSNDPRLNPGMPSKP